MFEDVPVNKDVIYGSLVEPWEHDDKVLVTLSVVVPALSKLIRKWYEDHLLGRQRDIIN